MLSGIFIPSNQLNIAAGDPAGELTPAATYEQDIWFPAAQFAADEFAKQGHRAVVEFVRGVGAATTDELNVMCDRGVAQAKAWGGDVVIVSFHSNAGAGVQYMYPLIGTEKSRSWAHRVRDNAIKYTNFVARSATVRSLMFFSHFNQFADDRVILMEIGEHQTKPSALYLWTYREYLGRILARSVIMACGYPLLNDGPMAQGVPVPPGSIYDKYRYKPSVPVGETTATKWTRVLEVKSPYMHGADVLAWQEGLIELGFLPVGENDGIYGKGTMAGTQFFQRSVFGVYPGSGRVGLNSWQAMMKKLGL